MVRLLLLDRSLAEKLSILFSSTPGLPLGVCCPLKFLSGLESTASARWMKRWFSSNTNRCKFSTFPTAERVARTASGISNVPVSVMLSPSFVFTTSSLTVCTIASSAFSQDWQEKLNAPTSTQSARLRPLYLKCITIYICRNQRQEVQKQPVQSLFDH